MTGKLLRNYTQNIDGLESVAGVSKEKLVQCHGSFDTATCLVCRKKSTLDEIREKIVQQTIPTCVDCQDPSAIIKPDIVFFGESLDDEFPRLIQADVERTDLLIVMGSSLKVRMYAYVKRESFL